MTYCISNDSGAWFGQLATAKNGVAVPRDYHLRRLWAAVKCAARCETQYAHGAVQCSETHSETHIKKVQFFLPASAKRRKLPRFVFYCAFHKPVFALRSAFLFDEKLYRLYSNGRCPHSAAYHNIAR